MAASRFCLWAAVAGALLVMAGAASAQTYPAKPVRFLSPGAGATELVARIIAQGLSERLGQQFFVEVKAGAGGNIGADAAAHAPADGYTLFLATQPHTVNASLYKSLTYDVINDFAPVSRLTASPLVVVVHPSVTVRSLADLVALAKAKPDFINYGTTGIGTATYLAPELFKTRADVKMTEVRYRDGGGAETAIMSGETSVYFGPIATLRDRIVAGELRAIAVTTAQRLPALPDVPTVAESGYPGFEYTNWHGLVVPAKTPKEIVATLNEATVAVLKNPDTAKRFEALGLTPAPTTPDEFAGFIKSETETWGRIVQQQGIRID